MRKDTMTTSIAPRHHETTYHMLIESEEKDGGLIETLVYLLLIVATAVTVWQCGNQPVNFANLGKVYAEQSATFQS